MLWKRTRTVLPVIVPIEQVPKDENNLLSVLPCEILLRIVSYSNPIENVTLLSVLNSYWYVLCAQPTIWKEYFSTFAFEPQDIYPTALLLDQDDWKTLYKRYASTDKFNSTMGLVQHKVPYKHAINNTKNDIIATFGDEITTGVHYYRMVYQNTKFGSMCGIAEVNNLSDIQETNCLAYFRDGSMSVPDGDRLIDRVQDFQGKMYRVFYELDAGDVLGLKIDIDHRIVSFFINGVERLHSELSVKQGDRFRAFCRFTVGQSFSVLPRVRTVEEYETGTCLEKQRQAVSTARVNKSI
jgi:hypothetical protein